MSPLKFNQSNERHITLSSKCSMMMILIVLFGSFTNSHKHTYKNLYLSQDIKRLSESGELSKIKNRSLSEDPNKQDYPYKVTQKMEEDLANVDGTLKQAVQQAEKNVEEERDKKEIENGVDDDGETKVPGYDEFGRKIKRDWSQPLKHEGNKCNLLLLKMFKLEGRLWSRKKDALKICPGVAENCCTYMDELVILKLWNEYSKPHIIEYVNKIVYSYSKILGLHYRIANISIKEVDFHSYQSRTVEYERTICERRDDVAFLDFNHGVEANIDALDIYLKKDDTATPKWNVLDTVIEGSIAKQVKKDMKKGKGKGKKGKGRKGGKRDRILEEVHHYHKWKGRILTELRDSMRNSRVEAEGIKKMIDEHPDNQVPEERKLEINSNEQTMNAPMKILMAGLKNSLDKIKENPEIKKIIEKTEMMKQRMEDEAMFKVKSNNAETRLDQARKNVNRKEQEHASNLKLTKKETIGIRNINWLKRKFQKALTQPVQQIHKIFVSKRRKLRDINDKVAIRLAEMHTMLEQKGLARTDYERILKKFPKMSDFNLWVYEQIRKGKKNIENMPEFMVFKEDKLNKFFKKTKKTLEDMLMMEKNFLAKQKNVPVDNDFLFKFMKTINKKDVPNIELPFYPKRDRVLPQLPKVPIHKISCFSYPVSFPRKFLIFNPTKFEFCYKSLLKLRKFDAQNFQGYLESVRGSIFELVYLKKNIYCDLCNQPTQQYFDMENEMIYYDMRFCRTLVTQFSEYVKWKNIILIEYLNEIFNYIKCFETNANHTVFPFKTYVAQQQREIYFIRRCLQNLDGPEYFKYCHFICKQFSYTGFDNFFIGNIDFLKNIFVLLVSFLRKMKISIPRNFHKEIVRGHGQFKMSEVINDYDYAKYMSDQNFEYFDKQNFREPVPEFRKLRNSGPGLWGNKPEIVKERPENLKNIYDTLEERTKDARLHPVHGIVFEKIGDNLRRVKDDIKIVKDVPVEKNNESMRILQEKPEKSEEEMKDTKDEEVEEIYDKIDTKINPANLRTLYIQGGGLHPIKTEGLSNFGYNVDELIPEHYSKIKLESLGSTTLHVVVPIGKKEENTFNQDIDMKFVIKQGDDMDKDLVTQLYDKREEQRDKKILNISKEEKVELENRLNPKEDYMKEFNENPNDKFEESDGEKMAMPEIDILF